MIRVENLCLQQGNFSLDAVNLQIETGQYAVLMGITGSGKTTLLEALCGLRPITAGRIWLEQHNVTHWPPSARGIGYVPQDVVLFPAMRIDRQIGFALEVRHLPTAEIRHRDSELAILLQIEHLLQRFPQGLSGGERQRVALARAIAFRPRLLCLDEPLSAVDPPQRQRLGDLLKTLHQHEQATILHVTHNLAEAADLGSVHFRFTDGQIVNGPKFTNGLLDA